MKLEHMNPVVTPLVFNLFFLALSIPVFN